MDAMRGIKALGKGRQLFDWVHLGTLGTRGGELAATLPVWPGHKYERAGQHCRLAYSCDLWARMEELPPRALQRLGHAAGAIAVWIKYSVT
jgi:hypothetical protein